MIPDTPTIRGALSAMRWFVGAVAVVALGLAILVPYHATDAFVFGSWSQRIAETGAFHHDGVGNSFLSRPLFLVTQGWLWNVFGVHEWIGRVLSLGFGALLLGSVAGLARPLVPGVLAAVVLLAVPEFAQNALSGLTDVPAAALAALAAYVLWQMQEGWRRAALLVVLAAAAVLAKSTILPSVVGLGLAHLVGPGAGLRHRLTSGSIPLAAGVAVALAYNATQAAHLGQDLYTFMTGGNADDPLRSENANLNSLINTEGRETVFLGMEWLGPYLVLPLLFAGVYSLVRVAGAGHRRAATVAAPLAVAASVALPALANDAGGRSIGPFDTARPVALLVTVAFALLLWSARYCPPDAGPSRVWVARMLIWAVPTLLAWHEVAPYNARYVAGAWAPLVLLIAVIIWTAALGAWELARVRGKEWARFAAAAVLALTLLAAVADMRNFDALGARPDGSINALRFARDVDPGDLVDPERMRTAADPQLGAVLGGARAGAGRTGSVMSNDGRLTFFFGSRLRVGTPAGCEEALRHDSVALILNALSTLSEERTNQLSREAARMLRQRPDPARLARCARTRVLSHVPGSHFVMTVDR